MSKSSDPKLTNPLDGYRSYSYHFILSVANTTSAFEKMLGSDNASQLATVENVPLGGLLNIGSEQAYLLVDTRRYSHYSILDVTTEHIYGTGSSVNPTVPTSTLTMRLIDTTGLSFFNTLMNTLQNNLQTTRSSAFFMLSTIYVGHKDDGTTQTLMISNTALTLITMDFEFNSSGSTYNIEFMETEGSPQRGASMEYMNSLGDITTISTKGQANNLGGMIQALEDALNQRSLEVYQKYSIQMAKKGSSQQPRKDSKSPKSGRLVQYMITIPDKWKAFPINAATRSVNVEQDFIHMKPQKSTDEVKKPIKQDQVAAAAQSSAKHFSYTMGITDAIKAILETSKDVLDLSQPKDGMATMYRTITNVTSDAATFVIHFDVMEHKIPAKDKDSKSVAAGGTNAYKNAPVIEYDYIFTGRNSDIRELKIAYMPGVEAALDSQTNMGQTRYATNAAAGQVAKNVEAVKKGTEESVEFNPNIRPNDPIFFANKSVLAKTGAHDQQEAVKHEDALDFNKKKQLYTQALAFYHYISSMELTMTIRGNPALLAKYSDRNSRGGVPPHTQIVSVEQVDSYSTQVQSTAEQNFQQDVKGRVASAKANYVGKYLTEKIRIGDVATTPLFVKINIRAPKVNADGNIADPAEGDMFTDEFFFKGTYQVLTIKSSFSNGEFSQELVLIPMDITGAYSESGSNSGKQENPSQSTAPYRQEASSDPLVTDDGKDFRYF